MARAFTDEERETIRRELMETALELFHEKGTRSLSIAELTRRAGIAQGSFYNFWKDKDALIADLVSYRARQKLERMEKDFSLSDASPTRYLARIIFDSAIDMTYKIQNQPVYGEAFRIFMKKEKINVAALGQVYGEFLDKLARYWLDHQLVKRVDQQGLINAILGSFVLCMSSEMFDKERFDELLYTYIFAVVSRYIDG